jgi:hypothetical protein
METRLVTAKTVVRMGRQPVPVKWKQTVKKVPAGDFIHRLTPPEVLTQHEPQLGKQTCGG